MAKKDYIDRGALQEIVYTRLKALEELYGAYDAYGSGYEECADRISEMPAADVAPVVHAEWIPSPDGINPIKCRRCGTVAPYRMELDFNHDIGLYPYKSNYCPHCGARMYGGKDETG